MTRICVYKHVPTQSFYDKFMWIFSVIPTTTDETIYCDYLTEKWSGNLCAIHAMELYNKWLKTRNNSTEIDYYTDEYQDYGFSTSLEVYNYCINLKK